MSEAEEYIAFLERNSDAHLTLDVETRTVYAHHRHYELVSGRPQVFERFDEWHWEASDARGDL